MKIDDQYMNTFSLGNPLSGKDCLRMGVGSYCSSSVAAFPIARPLSLTQRQLERKASYHPFFKNIHQCDRLARLRL